MPPKYSAPKAPKAKAFKLVGFETEAGEFPYMFIGALAGCDAIAQIALKGAVENPDAVTATEAQLGWDLPADVYEAASKTVVDISRAAYKYHKGSVKSFKVAVGEESWNGWVTMAGKADADGVANMIVTAKAAATARESRRIALQDALYFAGLTTDVPGSNATALLMRGTKPSNEFFQAFVASGPDDVAAMRTAAAQVAETIVADHADGSKKRKRVSAEEELSSKKARRAALMTAFIDAGVDIPAGEDMTDEERKFIEDGPSSTTDFMGEAETIATKRFISV